MQPQLTPKQQRFLDYLQREIARTGQCPSLRQAAADQGVSHAAIAQFFRVLEEKGYLKREGRYSRKVYLLNRAREAAALQRWCEIPIIGRVTAGLPMYAQTEWDGSIVLDAAVYRSQNLFALRVKGDSMNAAGILSSTPKTARSSWRLSTAKRPPSNAFFCVTTTSSCVRKMPIIPPCATASAKSWSRAKSSVSIVDRKE
jgi:DNA-binding transcriptional MocR family regulator